MVAYDGRRPVQQRLYGWLAREPRNFARSQRRSCFLFLLAAAYAAAAGQGLFSPVPEACGAALLLLGMALLARWALGAWVLYATRNEMPLPTENRRLSVLIGLRSSLLLLLVGAYLYGGALSSLIALTACVALACGFARSAYLYGFYRHDVRRMTPWRIAQVLFSLAGLAACAAAVWAVSRQSPWLFVALLFASQAVNCLCHAAPEGNQAPR